VICVDFSNCVLNYKSPHSSTVKHKAVVYFIDVLRQIQHLKNLEELYLDNNLLISLPHTIRHLKKLRVLDVSCNRLSTLPPTISEVTCKSVELLLFNQ